MTSSRTAARSRSHMCSRAPPSRIYPESGTSSEGRSRERIWRWSLPCRQRSACFPRRPSHNWRWAPAGRRPGRVPSCTVRTAAARPSRDSDCCTPAGSRSRAGLRSSHSISVRFSRCGSVLPWRAAAGISPPA